MERGDLGALSEAWDREFQRTGHVAVGMRRGKLWFFLVFSICMGGFSLWLLMTGEQGEWWGVPFLLGIPLWVGALRRDRGVVVAVAGVEVRPWLGRTRLYPWCSLVQVTSGPLPAHQMWLWVRGSFLLSSRSDEAGWFAAWCKRSWARREAAQLPMPTLLRVDVDAFVAWLNIRIQDAQAD